MTILDYSELKESHKFPDYFYPDRQNNDSYKIKQLKKYGAIRNLYGSVEINDKDSLKYWINNIQNISDMDINYYLLPISH